MYAVLEQNGTFSGATYNELTPEIEAHHIEYGHTFIEVVHAPEVNEQGMYDSPTAEQVEAYRIKKSNAMHEEYLASTDYLVLRKVETDEAISAEVLTQRAAARVALGR